MPSNTPSVQASAHTPNHFASQEAETAISDITRAIMKNESGVSIVIDGSELDMQDYCEMRAAQLCSLLDVISGAGHESFSRYGSVTQENIKWLARGLAHEISHLLPVVSRAKNGGCSR